MRTLTVRKHNLDAEAIAKLNPVIRATALYFTTRWSTTRWQMRRLDSWMRMRVRPQWVIPKLPELAATLSLRARLPLQLLLTPERHKKKPVPLSLNDRTL